jgi:DNA-binding transcriptional MerR regulator
MLIGELGRRTGVHTHQLRYYEAQGLLEPDRGANGYREYDEHAVVAVMQIRKLLDAGLSTDEISFLQPCLTGTAPQLDPCAETLDTLNARLDRLDERLDTLTRSRHALQDFIDATERLVPDDTQASCDTTTLAPASASTHSLPPIASR